MQTFFSSPSLSLAQRHTHVQQLLSHMFPKCRANVATAIWRLRHQAGGTLLLPTVIWRPFCLFISGNSTNLRIWFVIY